MIYKQRGIIMGSFDLSCSLTGINIAEGDEVLVVKIKDWDNSKGVYHLSNYISTIIHNQKSQRFNPKLREAIFEYTNIDLQDTDPFEIFHYGSYIDCGKVTGLDNIKDVSTTYYFKKELIDLIKDKYIIKKEGHQPSNIYLFKSICDFAFLIRRELQYSTLLSTQFFEIEEAKAQIDLLKLHKDILNKKLKYEEDNSYDAEWHVDCLRTLIELKDI
jgi:hypothetical protein